MKPQGNYFARVIFHDGRVCDSHHSFNPSESCDYAYNGVSKNAEIIARIELHDTTGPLETVWASSWLYEEK